MKKSIETFIIVIISVIELYIAGGLYHLGTVVYPRTWHGPVTGFIGATYFLSTIAVTIAVLINLWSSKGEE